MAIETRDQDAAARAQKRHEHDQQVVEKLAAAGAPILLPGKPRLEAEALKDGQVRDLGYRHHRWRLLEKACASAAAQIAQDARQFVAEHKPQNLVHVRIRPPCSPVDVTSYAEAHLRWQYATSRAIEYLESRDRLSGLHLTIHPRPCNGSSQIDLHFHLMAQLKPENVPHVAEYLRQKFGNVFVSAENDADEQRDFTRDVSYAERGIAPSLAEMDSALLAAFYEQTHNNRLRFSFPRGAFRAFRSELRRREAKNKRPKNKKRARHPPHQTIEVGSRTIAIAPVWHGQELLRSRIIVTYENPPTPSLLVSPANPENHLSSTTHQIPDSSTNHSPVSSQHALLSNGAHMLRRVLRPDAVSSLDILASSHASCRATIWPLKKSLARCDQTLLIHVVAALLADSPIVLTVFDRPSIVKPAAVSIEGVDDPARGLDLRRHGESVMKAVTDHGQWLVQSVEHIGRLVGHATLNVPATVTCSLVSGFLHRWCIMDPALVQAACELANRIATAHAARPAAASDGPTRAETVSTGATDMPKHTDGQPTAPAPQEPGTAKTSPAGTPGSVAAGRQPAPNGQATPPVNQEPQAAAKPVTTSGDPSPQADNTEAPRKPAGLAMTVEKPTTTRSEPSARTVTNAVASGLASDVDVPNGVERAPSADDGQATPLGPRDGAESSGSADSATQEATVPVVEPAKPGRRAKPGERPEAVEPSTDAPLFQTAAPPTAPAGNANNDAAAPGAESGGAVGTAKATSARAGAVGGAANGAKSRRSAHHVIPESVNPDSASAAAAASVAALASRPRMRAEVHLWCLPAGAGIPDQGFVMSVAAQLAEQYRDFRVMAHARPAPVAPQHYVEIAGLDDPIERARWRRHIETVVAAALRDAAADCGAGDAGRTAQAVLVTPLLHAA